MNIKNMTPKEIVAELDKYIIGQDEAKKSVAIALRNRYRRNQLSDEMREEITPKNILMMGPTGVGKTEIARRLARIMEAPFIKVEATKYTEVGYVGRDVESMIRDLVEASVRITKQKHIDEKYDIADQRAEDLILEALVPDAKKKKKSGESNNPFDFILNSGGYTSQKEEYENKQNAENAKPADDIAMAREQVRRELRDGKLENELVEIDVEVTPNTNQLDMQNEGMGIAIGNIFGDMMPKKTKHKKMPVKEARKILREQEAQSMLDMDQVVDEALIPALDAVGGKYERGQLFLPQLLQAASAAQSAFEEIRAAMAKDGSAAADKGRIVLATVKGDVHDIGKNIVKVILENYGFEVIDLGRDVPVETVVDTVREKHVRLVGLSALMTTTLKSMEETIAALHEAHLDCKVMTGGAVLTADYAKKIGADYYAKDAKQSADIAKVFFRVQ